MNLRRSLQAVFLNLDARTGLITITEKAGILRWGQLKMNLEQAGESGSSWLRITDDDDHDSRHRSRPLFALSRAFPGSPTVPAAGQAIKSTTKCTQSSTPEPDFSSRPTFGPGQGFPALITYSFSFRSYFLHDWHPCPATAGSPKGAADAAPEPEAPRGGEGGFGTISCT